MTRARVAGLTLVEVLVALFILAVLAVLSYRTVAAMTETSRHLDSVGRDFERLADAVDLIERDLVFSADLPGELAFRGDGGEAGRPGELRFQRAASGYLSGPGAAPAMVGYRLREGRLEKLVYPEDNRLSGEPSIRPLLDGRIGGLVFRFRDRAGAWRPAWPAENTTGLPVAVEVRLVLSDGSEIVRLVALP